MIKYENLISKTWERWELLTTILSIETFQVNKSWQGQDNYRWWNRIIFEWNMSHKFFIMYSFYVIDDLMHILYRLSYLMFVVLFSCQLWFTSINYTRKFCLTLWNLTRLKVHQRGKKELYSLFTFQCCDREYHHCRCRIKTEYALVLRLYKLHII